MNKFDLINKVLMSDLQAENKCLLIELIVRADDQWVSWPSVERLCKVRGIKHEKNFKGADHYLPGLVTKTKKGRKNVYTINTPAVAGLSDAVVVIRHTPPLNNTPAVEGSYTPAVADNTPAVEGANTTSNTTEDTTEAPVSADASPVPSNYKYKTVSNSSNSRDTETVYMIDLAGVTKTVQHRDTPAVEGVSEVKRILTPGEKKDYERALRVHKVTDAQAKEALAIIQGIGGHLDIYEATTDALVRLGAVLPEAVEVW